MSTFAKMPVGVFCDDRLFLRHIRVLGAILSFADQQGKCHPTHRQIAQRSCLREKDIAVVTKQLCDLGWLEKVGNGGRSSPADYRVKTTPSDGVVIDAKTTPSNRVVNTTPSDGVDSKTETTPSDGKKPPRPMGINHPVGWEKTTPSDGVGIQQTNQQTNNRPTTDHLQHPLQNVPETPPISRAKKSPPLTPEMQQVCRETFDAYSVSYLRRYGIDPVFNAKVAGQVVQFVKRIGMVDAPHVASFYVGHPDAWYTRIGHSIDALLKDAEKLRTEWATGSRMTAATARQIDATQTNLNAAETAKRMLEARRSGA